MTAAGAYYKPVVSKRQNLKVLTGAEVGGIRVPRYVLLTLFMLQVTKIVFKPDPDVHGNLIATGVEFVANGKTFTVQVSKEIILSAGTIKTPQLLELSGEL